MISFSHILPLISSLSLSFFVLFGLRHAAKALASGDIVRPTDPFVARMSLSWMQSMCLWKELVQVGVVSSGSTASLRMNDFTRKVRTVTVPRPRTSSQSSLVIVGRAAPLFSLVTPVCVVCIRVLMFLFDRRCRLSLKPSPSYKRR